MKLTPRIALWVLGIAVIAAVVVGVMIGGAASSTPQAPGNDIALTGPPSAAAPIETETPTPTPTPSPTVNPAAGTALAVLETLPVKGRAPMTGYARAEFGPAWADVDDNGCDTRNDILGRDLTDVTRDGNCKVTSGILVDPYSAKTIHFERGVGTSTAVQIDHVVALGDAWQKGAQQLTDEQREHLANDPLNLLAVDGPANEAKGDGDAATWLPPNKSYRCAYVARQVAVKAAYHLWVTRAEHDAIARILTTCPGKIVPTAASIPDHVTPRAAKVTTTAPEPTTKPAAPKKTTPRPPAPRAVHPGAFCSPDGATGVSSAGTPMVCGTTANSARNRWHRG